jgi:hypothetical protein
MNAAMRILGQLQHGGSRRLSGMSRLKKGQFAEDVRSADAGPCMDPHRKIRKITRVALRKLSASVAKEGAVEKRRD